MQLCTQIIEFLYAIKCWVQVNCCIKGVPKHLPNQWLQFLVAYILAMEDFMILSSALRVSQNLMKYVPKVSLFYNRG